MASPSNEANQAIHNLRGQWKQEALYKVGLLVSMLSKGGDSYPEEKIAKALDFASVEIMRAQLKSWGVSGLVSPDNTSPGDTAPGKGAPGGASLNPLKGGSEELPPPANAADLFEYALRALKTNLHFLGNHKQIRTGSIFEALGEHPEEDEPRRRGFWLHPHPWEVHLITAYFLNYYYPQDIDLLLQRLHPKGADPAARQEAKAWVTKALFGDPDKAPKHRGGLFREMRKVASVVRGAPVKEGRPRNIPEGLREHTIVREIEAMRREGLTEPEIISEVCEYWGLDESHGKRLLNFRPEGW